MSFYPQGNTALTPREREVLRFLAKGHSNAEIAREHHVAIGTVKAQVSSIMMKLGAKNRTHAVILSGAVLDSSSSPQHHEQVH